MGIRFDAAGEYVDQGVSIPAWDACTLMAWVYISVDRASDSYIIQWPDSGGGGGSYCGINASRQLFVEEAANRTLGSTLATGTWYHIALATGPSNVTVYLNGVQDSQRASASFTPVAIMWGGNTPWLNGIVGALKCFAAELTAEQVALEMYTLRPSGRVACHSFYPARKVGGSTWGTLETRDYGPSGLAIVGHTSGTLSVEDGPPIPWGAAPLLFDDAPPIRRWLLGAH